MGLQLDRTDQRTPLCSYCLCCWLLINILSLLNRPDLSAEPYVYKARFVCTLVGVGMGVGVVNGIWRAVST